MTIMLLPEPTAPDTPDVIGWKVGPGLVRVEADLDGPDLDGPDLPVELHGLVTGGVLRSVHVQPGRIETRVAAGHSTRADGPAIRAALFEVLSRPGGWPVSDGPADAAHLDAVSPADPHPTDPAEQIRRGADRELETGVREVLAGEFGVYTASHGGHVEIVDITDGVVTVALSGACHGCAAAEVTLRDNLERRLRRLPGYAGLRTRGDRQCISDQRRTAGTAFLGRLPGLRTR